ncbi:hypothetical protein K388_07176 [Streptomyces sp. KhCrAH-43]|uniref:hypothetical protein n=1 Tax=unclassified Streptomyces TaxID=2593676 RepID=UPI0003A0D819|nr:MULTISPECIES: hypothetical protein [unclassified Streptomyces]RAJ47795.1 hypothetical protein K388_07176 [Streptomyces sp. KhCrAH-43]
MSTIDPDAELKARITEIKERFATDSADRTLTVRRDDGLYRHLVVEMPRSTAYWFEVMTWPGALAITGRTGSYIFRRDEDMLLFFRTHTRSGWEEKIDTRYWAEKVQPHGDRSVQAYAKDRVHAYIKEAAQEAEAAYPGLLAEVEEELFSRYSSVDLESEAGAKAALAAFEFDGFRFDTADWKFTEYDDWFLYTCQALAWTVAQYDASVPAAV